MIQINDKYPAEQSTPQVNNTNPIKPKSLLHKKMLFTDAVILLPHIYFHIISHHIALDITLNGYDSTSRCGTSNHTIKICLVNLSIENNDNNSIAVGKEVNALMLVIHAM